jgi:hypothetical protein
VASFKVLSWHLSGGIQINYENPLRICLPHDIRTGLLPVTVQKLYRFIQLVRCMSDEVSIVEPIRDQLKDESFMGFVEN